MSCFRHDELCVLRPVHRHLINSASLGPPKARPYGQIALFQKPFSRNVLINHCMRDCKSVRDRFCVEGEAPARAWHVESEDGPAFKPRTSSSHSTVSALKRRNCSPATVQERRAISPLSLITRLLV